jgi:hypothetical protein
MRLSQWHAKAPSKEAASAKVAAVIGSSLGIFGSEPDPHCWVAWGEDPAIRYLVFVPTIDGLIQLHVRVNVSGEGPRASGKLVRWSRVQVGELGTEIQGGHRLVTFQVETQVLNGVDESADAIGAFARTIFAATDGRPAPAETAASPKSAAARPPAKAKPKPKPTPVRRLPAQTGT